MTTNRMWFFSGYCGTCSAIEPTDGFAVECSKCGGTLIVTDSQ